MVRPLLRGEVHQPAPLRHERDHGRYGIPDVAVSGDVFVSGVCGEIEGGGEAGGGEVAFGLSACLDG